MKNSSICGVVSLLVLSGSLASCGGSGDDDAGSVTPFSVVPSTLTLTAATGAPAGACSSGFAGEVFIYGGAAPYRLNNTAPDAVVLNKSQVGDRGGSFTVSFTGICVSPVSIVVVDKLDKQVTLTLNNGSAS